MAGAFCRVLATRRRQLYANLSFPHVVHSQYSALPRDFAYLHIVHIAKTHLQSFLISQPPVVYLWTFITIFTSPQQPMSSTSRRRRFPKPKVDRNNRIRAQIEQTPDGKGLGLFASDDFVPGVVILQVDALFVAKGSLEMTPKRFVELYSEVTEHFDGLREQSERYPAARPTEDELEQFLARPPLFPSDAEKTGAMRVMLCELIPGWKHMDEDLKELEIQQLCHFVDGVRKMHDFDDNCLGFNVHTDVINHSCIPNAFMSTSKWTKRFGQPEGWNVGKLQVRPSVRS